MGCLVGGDMLEKAVSAGGVSGFDLRPFNRFRPTDLRQEELEAVDTKVAFRASASGKCVGILQWVKLYLDAETEFENRPSTELSPSAWRHMFYPFSRIVDVAPGQNVDIRVIHNKISIALTLDEPH
jgi:hypothetical protein